MSYEYVCTRVRFTFWDGKVLYTVEYCPSLRMWFVFWDNAETNCLAKYTLGKNEMPVCTQDKAHEYLNNYFNQH